MEKCFLDELIELIDCDKYEEIEKIICKNKNSLVTFEQMCNFSRQSGCLKKQKIKGAININGSGGSGYIKPNLSSIAALYLGLSTDKTFVKTGSGSVTGLWGSSDFFREWGFLQSQKRDYIWEKYGFAYYDYLEISPWKKYKQLLRNNKYLDELFWTTVFLDYETSYYFLGISKKEYHDGLQRLHIENRPTEELITYYTDIDGHIVDEMLMGKIFLNNVLFMRKITCCDTLPINNLSELKRINKHLLDGTEIGYWKECLKLAYIVIAIQSHVAKSQEEAEEKFEEAYINRVVAKVRKEIYGN